VHEGDGTTVKDTDVIEYSTIEDSEALLFDLS
jgi:hypothetical protein